MINGVINVYKEAGFTSHDVVAKMRGILKTKKIGHTGTLDPEAEGVLPICVGNATKLVDLLTDETKEYEAVLRLGVVTDTQDMTGKVLEEHYDEALTLHDHTIRDAIMKFEGESMQIPPMYSALKVNGQKLYDLARKGIEVERKPRRVVIDEIEMMDVDLDGGLHNTDNSGGENGLHNENHYVNKKIRVVCSKGTYIRTLIHDIGQVLGCGASMEYLERTAVGRFKKKDALTLSEIQKLADEDSLHKFITPVDVILDNYPALHAAPEAAKALDNGNQLPEDMIVEHRIGYGMLTARKVYRIYSYDNQFYGLYEYHSGWKVLKPVKMFLNS